MTLETLKLENFYQSTDLALCTALSLYYPLEAIDSTNPKAVFLFKRDNGLEALIESYWKGEMRVDPQRYFSQLKLIKTRLFEVRRTL